MSSEGRTLTVNATPEWVARSLIQIARRPATPDEDDHLVTIITGYFDQFHTAGRASRDAEVAELKRIIEDIRSDSKMDRFIKERLS